MRTTVRNLPYAAGYRHCASACPHDEALKAITLNPAEIWGVADQLGSLDVGKTANVVVADGDPLGRQDRREACFHRWAGSSDDEPPDASCGTDIPK